jgi:ribosomal protein L7/L12
MKKHGPFVVILFLAALGAGCGKSSTGNDATASPSATATQASGTETQSPASSASAPQPTASNNTGTSQPSMAASQPSTTGDTTVSRQFQQVKQDVNQTTQDLKTYTYEQKDAFVQTMQAEIDKLNQELLQLTAKIDVAGDSIKAAAQPKLEALKTQVAALGIYLNEAKNATAATWDEVKADAQKAYAEAKQDFQDAGQWIDQQVNH